MGAHTCMSLREIARRLDIPPSTIVSYKDRFAAFLPFVDDGRRRSYPPAALEIFREIRALSEEQLPASEIERRLALRYAELLARGGGSDGAVCPDAPVLVRVLAGVLEKVTGLLAEQCDAACANEELHREVESLRREVARLRRERAQDVRGDRLKVLREQIVRLRREKRELEQAMLDAVGTAGAAGRTPPTQFMELPLVIRSGRGEFLGVGGRGRRNFTLRKLLALVRRGASGGRSLGVAWTRNEGFWSLSLGFGNGDGEGVRRFVLNIAETLTPRRNIVACLDAMSVDGQDVPAAYLLDFFRRIRTEFVG
ncbi:DNA-binding transcriptional MerR regulator [Desulfobaculum xiamenense]|uniref:DNA-binding transcriptional MerR regulator n=1 Tax=Desulfobaculum xiamenense TaxID=995050 RepID=A0A846QLJ8_9BACT|nr:MerR family transcriptional regulator [Desulfobaculum xiamenense]NJB67332.1 DNA-binding transcriptional MerR regulator [Desulfobaculum xiamenense]